jgi:hypothetical protein
MPISLNAKTKLLSCFITAPYADMEFKPWVIEILEHFFVLYSLNWKKIPLLLLLLLLLNLIFCQQWFE